MTRQHTGSRSGVVHQLSRSGFDIVEDDELSHHLLRVDTQEKLTKNL